MKLEIINRKNKLFSKKSKNIGFVFKTSLKFNIVNLYKLFRLKIFTFPK
jgi:hypothetical protein